MELVLDRSEIVWNKIDDNRSWSMIDGTYRVKFIIPISNPNRKWWQFWKKRGLSSNDAEIKISELIDKYKYSF